MFIMFLLGIGGPPHQHMVLHIMLEDSLGLVFICQTDGPTDIKLGLI